MLSLKNKFFLYFSIFEDNLTGQIKLSFYSTFVLDARCLRSPSPRSETPNRELKGSLVREYSSDPSENKDKLSIKQRQTDNQTHIQTEANKQTQNKQTAIKEGRDKKQKNKDRKTTIYTQNDMI